MNLIKIFDGTIVAKIILKSLIKAKKIFDAAHKLNKLLTYKLDYINKFYSLVTTQSKHNFFICFKDNIKEIKFSNL
jgi:hypothetical protein